MVTGLQADGGDKRDREYVFARCCSGSMGPGPMAKAKEIVRAAPE